MKEAKNRTNSCKQPISQISEKSIGQLFPVEILHANTLALKIGPTSLTREAPACDQPFTVARVSRVVELATPIV